MNEFITNIWEGKMADDEVVIEFTIRREVVLETNIISK